MEIFLSFIMGLSLGIGCTLFFLRTWVFRTTELSLEEREKINQILRTNRRKKDAKSLSCQKSEEEKPSG